MASTASSKAAYCDFVGEQDGAELGRAPWSVAEGAASIEIPHSATISVFPEFKKALLREMPQASFAPRLANHDVAVAMLARSEYDLALATFHPKVPQAEEFGVFKGVSIARERLVVVSPLGIDDADELPLHVSHRLTYIGQTWQNCRVPLATSKEVEHGMAADIRSYCLSGEGRGVVPETLVEAEIASGRLTLISVDVDLSYSFSVYCSRRRASRPSAFGEPPPRS